MKTQIKKAIEYNKRLLLYFSSGKEKTILRFMTEINKYKQIIELNQKPLLNIAVVISSFYYA